MHRRRVKLSSRVGRLTERLGHGSILVRGAPVRTPRHRCHVRRSRPGTGEPPCAAQVQPRTATCADAVQEAVLDELRTNDYAIVAFSGLFPDDGVRRSVEDEGDAFRELEDGSQRASLARTSTRTTSCAGRRGTGDRCCIALVHRMPVRTAARRRELVPRDVVDARGRRFWYPARSGGVRAHPIAALAPRLRRPTSSEGVPLPCRCRRGYGAARVCCRECVRRCRRRYLPWRPASRKYPTPEEFEEHVSAEDIPTFTAPSGTLILCNTSGFHRGGFATGKPRTSRETSLACVPESLTEYNYTIWKGSQPSLRRRPSSPRQTPCAADRQLRGSRWRGPRSQPAFILVLVFVLLPRRYTTTLTTSSE